METATSLAIGQLSGYLRGLTQRLDPGTGWYGEFLRRDPQGLQACMEGAAMPPWDVLESLLGDLEVARGAELAAREREYAARLRAAAVAVWDRLPGGAEDLRTLLAAAAEQRAVSDAATGTLTARLGATADPAQARALTRELAWIRDDAARAASRHEDLASRLRELEAPAGTPVHPRPARREATAPGQGRSADPWAAGPRPAGAGPQPSTAGHAPEAGRPAAGTAAAGARPGAEEGGAVPGVPPRREPGEDGSEPPVGRAEGRWLRGGRRGGGARYAGAAAPAPAAFTPPPGHAQEPAAAPRGARFGHPGPERAAHPGPERAAHPGPERAAHPGPERAAHPGPERAAHPAADPGTGSPAPGRSRPAAIGRPRFTPPGPADLAPPEPQGRPTIPGRDPRSAPLGAPGPAPAAPAAAGIAAVIGELLVLRAQGRGGEAHVLLCEAAAWPAGRLPALADELVRAGLAADWATLLWEAASLPPERLAAAAAALGEAGRHDDCEALLRQGAARPAAEIAEAALALAGTGRTREADALLGAFVKVRTAEEAVRLARRDPQWFTPRLLRAAEALSAAHHRDLVHALRVAKPPVQ
ncbi:hypothetical protein [Streptomyces vinaceus]|uniref:hypothetical protein n=1 Tax=Streptomyces vinaceus TaxID=1960 RepID=UPI0038268244